VYAWGGQQVVAVAVAAVAVAVVVPVAVAVAVAEVRVLHLPHLRRLSSHNKYTCTHACMYCALHCAEPEPERSLFGNARLWHGCALGGVSVCVRVCHRRVARLRCALEVCLVCARLLFVCSRGQLLLCACGLCVLSCGQISLCTWGGGGVGCGCALMCADVCWCVPWMSHVACM
jgi:hypothetical protein